jgi:hypothetical protein
VLQVETAGAGFDVRKRLKLLSSPISSTNNFGRDPSGSRAQRRSTPTSRLRRPRSKRYTHRMSYPLESFGQTGIASCASA